MTASVAPEQRCKIKETATKLGSLKFIEKHNVCEAPGAGIVENVAFAEQAVPLGQ